MAVQAQYPSNVLLLNRKEQETEEFPKSPNDFVLPSMDLLDNKGDEHPRKRTRDTGGGASMAAAQVQQQPINRAPPPLALSPMTMVSLARLQNHPPPPPPPPLVSTGLRLSLEYHQNQNQMIQTDSSSSSTSFTSFVSQELVAQFNQERDEIDQFLLAQGERFRRALAERRLRHYRALMSAAEESALRRLRQKETELEQVTRRGGELYEHLSRLQMELRAWQATAMTNQAMAAALKTQLEQAMAKAAEANQRNGDDESPAAEDAESSFVDPERVEPDRACRACRTLPATVVLLPCRHLCLCEACDAYDVATAAGGVGGVRAPSCPVCQCVRTGSLQVLLV